MGKAKKKNLPKDFEDQLRTGDISTLKAIFESCDVDARGGYAKQTTLAFDECPDELARWLVAEGADLAATDTWGYTPLHSRSRSWRGGIEVLVALGADVNSNSASVGTPLHAAASSQNVEKARLLLAHGARVDPVDNQGLTPLAAALRGASNAQLERLAPFADLLLKAGAKVTPQMKTFVETLGKTFEFHRAGFNPDRVDAASDALDRLYKLFDVVPLARRVPHDARSPIRLPPGRWQDQHEALWELLVPSSGSAATVQGEVIRISGRVANELDGNGGVNWSRDYGKMVDAWLAHLGTGNPLAQSELSEAGRIAVELKRRSGNTGRMAQLAVAWVGLNPNPIKLGATSYGL